MSSKNKQRYRRLVKDGKYHQNQMKRISREQGSILEKDGYQEKSHWMIWMLIAVAIIVAVVWYLFLR